MSKGNLKTFGNTHKMEKPYDFLTKIPHSAQYSPKFALFCFLVRRNSKFTAKDLGKVLIKNNSLKNSLINNVTSYEANKLQSLS